jgi:hypothetical protein
MRADIRCVLLAICAVLMTVLSVHAEDRSFAALLIQARAQAAAGHRWTPPGDNMTETIMHMIDLIPTATPAQLSELSALIESGRTGPLPTTPKSDVVTEGPPSEAVPAPPPVLPSRPGAERNGQVAFGQVPPSPITASPITASPVPASPVIASPVIASPVTPSPIMTSPVTGSSVTGSPVTGSPVTGSPVTGGPIAPGLITPVPITTSPVTISPVTISPVTISPVTGAPIAPSQAEPDAGSRAAVLFARGLDAELHGDFSGARRFYFSSAQEDDAAAARHLGRLYDPAYLRQKARGGVDPDPTLARHWYERAIRLGDAEAGPLLQALSVR